MELRFDFAEDDATTGFRLEDFELYNWGTYDKKIVNLHLGGSNALLTGDIGSGKSTIVDALTTLIVPHNKIVFNKAAGATTKERTLYSYIVGEYKSAQDENFGHAKAVSLRDEKSFSVLLARFYNSGFDEVVTLAQFFYIVQKQVHKFFVVSKQKLSIKEDFLHFRDIRGLKKSLRTTAHTEVFESFKEYSRTFSRAMGIKNAQALNLFYQTVSLKSIDNLTNFIRKNMLEESDIEGIIDDLCLNFAELNHAYGLVLDAIEQIALLEPIEKEYKKYCKNQQNKQLYTTLHQKLKRYFALFEVKLLESKIEELDIKLTKSLSAKKKIDEVLEKLAEDITEIRLELQKNGADRIKKIEDEIKHYTALLQGAKEYNAKYNTLLKALGYRAVSNEHRFLITQKELQEEFATLEEKKASYQNEITIDTVSLQRYDEKLLNLREEIVYLQNNRSNIPHKVSKIRDTMAKELGIPLDELPFIGELIEVRDSKFHGAIERILHNTALSLLVDEHYYHAVSEYVEKTDLRGKLVYLHVKRNKKPNNFVEVVPNSILTKIEIKAQSSYFDVVSGILNERFNIACVDSMDDFRKFKKALSVHGQFKTNFLRHEKDDRYNINDKTRWVLGWDNVAKLKELQTNYDALQEKKEFLFQRIQETKNKEKALQKQRDNLRDALQYEEFEKIDWYRYAQLIEELKEQKEELQKSNDVIKTLQKRLFEVELQQKQKAEERDEIAKNIGTLEQKKEDKVLDFNSVKLILENEELSQEQREKFDTLKENLIDYKLHLGNIATAKTKLNEQIQREINNASRTLERLSSSLVGAQSKYINRFPVLSKELLAEVEYSEEFIKKLQLLKKDNLPKYKKKFKELFKEKTIHKVLTLQTQLEKLSDDIKYKIQTINKSLKDIEYSDGTFIELIAERSQNREIREFRQKLKQITTGTIDENNEYDEAKFLQIKELIDRFNGREGYVDVDKRYRMLVSDVRNWYDFSAVEKYISDGSVKEFYAHSGGKSGGQKEKLAYTVLASSLAYQFGLEYDSIQSRSFRFVMIDEAFGRGSDESTRYALRLFEKLRLQLLVITPKQKINVIEPFVKSVHFVHNQDGMDSTLISMSIEHYLQNKKKQEMNRNKKGVENG
jgi:uncharacterized protein YPO0396